MGRIMDYNPEILFIGKDIKKWLFAATIERNLSDIITNPCTDKLRDINSWINISQSPPEGTLMAISSI